MADWLFKRNPNDTRTVVYNDAQLASFVSMGTASGMEQIRSTAGNGEWIALHTRPWFREVAQTPADRTDDQHAAKRHKRRGGKIIGMLVGTYASAAVLAGMIAASGPSARPVVALFGVSVLVGGVVAVVRRAIKRNKRVTEVLALTEGAPAVVTPPIVTTVKPEVQRDELQEQLSGLAADLELASQSLKARVDVSALTRTAKALRDQRAVLQQMLANDQREALDAELAGVREQAATASDPSLIDALSDQARTLESRMSSLDSTRRAAMENEARQRVLVHEVASLRLELAQARVDVALEDRTIDRLAQLKQQLDDETRISGELDETVKKTAQRRAIGPS